MVEGRRGTVGTGMTGGVDVRDAIDRATYECQDRSGR
jgi:hypothetical protein